MRRRGAARGFTLMEVLVVLVLVSMISTLLIQGFSYVMNLRVRFLTRVEEQTVTLLQTHWITRVTAGLTACRPEEGMVFSGEAGRFQGLTLAPLNGPAGAPTPVTLEWRTVNGDSILQYVEGKMEPLGIGRWAGATGTDNAAGFIYLDKEGGRHNQWPPSMGVFPQLPRAILLQAPAARRPEAWLIALPGRQEPKLGLKELFPDI